LQEISIKPIAIVQNELEEIKGDAWKKTISILELHPDIPSESLVGISDFSHLEIVFYFHKITKVVFGKDHPRRDKSIPKVGIFAMRKPHRPNQIGTTIVKLIKQEDRKLWVMGLDAINGTPIIDIKPIVTLFLPKEKITEPEWI